MEVFVDQLGNSSALYISPANVLLPEITDKTKMRSLICMYTYACMCGGRCVLIIKTQKAYPEKYPFMIVPPPHTHTYTHL